MLEITGDPTADLDNYLARRFPDMSFGERKKLYSDLHAIMTQD